MQEKKPLDFVFKKADQYFAEAKHHLEKLIRKLDDDPDSSMARCWNVGCNGCRAGQKDSVLSVEVRCQICWKFGPLYWQVCSWMMMRTVRLRMRCWLPMRFSKRGQCRAHLPNRCYCQPKTIDTFEFGMMWCSIFPEQLTMETAMRIKSNGQPRRYTSNESTNATVQEKGYKSKNYFDFGTLCERRLCSIGCYLCCFVPKLKSPKTLLNPI